VAHPGQAALSLDGQGSFVFPGKRQMKGVPSIGRKEDTMPRQSREKRLELSMRKIEKQQREAEREDPPDYEKLRSLAKERARLFKKRYGWC